MKNTIKTNYKTLLEVLNGLPYSCIIVDSNRNIIFSNKAFLDKTEKKTFDDLIGLSAGHAINCKHINPQTGECGTSDPCRFCGILQSIVKSQISKKSDTEEARVIVNKGNHTTDYDFKITASPFNVDNESLTIVTMQDISGEKRKRALERVFFHDILNKTGSLRGVAQLLKKNPKADDLDELLNFVYTISHELNEEILVQKQLMAAENDELTINVTAVKSDTIVQQSAEQIRQHTVAKNRKVAIEPEPFVIEFNTDALLLKRILINMLKNALEASKEEETITITCKKGEKNTIVFSVHNPEYIPEDVQSQIFHRSFSTKASNRGLGTYSMKLLGERYLNGRVSFTSAKKEGTTFYIALPI